MTCALMKNSLLTLVVAFAALTSAVPTRADTSVYEPTCFTNLAGLAGTSGTVNGTGTAAQFNQPWPAIQNRQTTTEMA